MFLDIKKTLITMKYIKLFLSHLAHETYINGLNYIEPYVSYDLEHVHYNKLITVNVIIISLTCEQDGYDRYCNFTKEVVSVEVPFRNIFSNLLTKVHNNELTIVDISPLYWGVNGAQINNAVYDGTLENALSALSNLEVFCEGFVEGGFEDENVPEQYSNFSYFNELWGFSLERKTFYTRTVSTITMTLAHSESGDNLGNSLIYNHSQLFKSVSCNGVPVTLTSGDNINYENLSSILYSLGITTDPEEVTLVWTFIGSAVPLILDGRRNLAEVLLSSEIMYLQQNFLYDTIINSLNLDNIKVIQNCAFNMCDYSDSIEAQIMLINPTYVCILMPS